MTINTHDVGEVVRVTGLFKDINEVLADPTAVFFSYIDPSGNTTNLQYLVNVALVKDSTGTYHVDIEVDEAGDYHYRWVSTGTGKGAEIGQFMVKPQQVPG